MVYYGPPHWPGMDLWLDSNEENYPKVVQYWEDQVDMPIPPKEYRFILAPCSSTRENYKRDKIEYCPEMRLTEFHAAYMLACADSSGDLSHLDFKGNDFKSVDPLTWAAYHSSPDGPEGFGEGEVPKLMKGLMKRLKELKEKGQGEDLTLYERCLQSSEDNYDASSRARIHIHKKMMKLREDFAAEDDYKSLTGYVIPLPPTLDFDEEKKMEEMKNKKMTEEQKKKQRLKKVWNIWKKEEYSMKYVKIK